MKKKCIVPQLLIALVLLLGLLQSCSGVSRATDFLTNPSPRELYGRKFDHAPQLFKSWENKLGKSLQDKISVELPYRERGRFHPERLPVYSYELKLQQGEKLQVKVLTDSLETLVFLDLYRKKEDSLEPFEHLKSAEFQSAVLEEEISETGTYKLILQPEIAARTGFELKIETSPVYLFPVVGKGNSAVQSFWGASRDGGRRSHEGIDIFASRGTPVIAITPGQIRSIGNKGLGGKQVWLWDSERRLSLYYAHLDSIIAIPGMKVKPGDTLGLVGNTGNARTTPPHLHFGIYAPFQGAVNPYPYVFQPSQNFPTDGEAIELSNSFLLTATKGNLRSGPSIKSEVLGQVAAPDTLMVLGKSDQWYHIRTEEGNSFLHESLGRML